MPTPKEIGFPNLLVFKPTKKPAAAFLTGYKNGVSAIFEKGKTSNPIEVVITIYVYSSTADARLAWQNSCSTCKTLSAPAGLRLKAVAGTSAGAPTLREVTVCGNVYLDEIERGPESAAKLDSDVAKVANAVYTRATHGGLSSCTTK